MATMTKADVYGVASQAGAVAQAGGIGAVQVTGPNPSSVTTSQQGGGVPLVGGGGPAFTWVGFVVALVILRVALEMGGEAR